MITPLVPREDRRPSRRLALRDQRPSGGKYYEVGDLPMAQSE